MGSNHYENRRSYPTKPLKYKSAEQVQELIDGYFTDCDANNKPYTITGLAYALGTCRKVLLDYQYQEQKHIDSKIADKISDAITRAKQRCEVYANEALYDKCKARGAERDLAVNYAWRTDDDGNNTQVRVVFEGGTTSGNNDAK